MKTPMSKRTSSAQTSCTVGPTTVMPGAGGNTAPRSASSAGALRTGSSGARIRPAVPEASRVAQRVDVDAAVQREQAADAGQREAEADLDRRERCPHRDQQREPAAPPGSRVSSRPTPVTPIVPMSSSRTPA